MPWGILKNDPIFTNIVNLKKGCSFKAQQTWSRSSQCWHCIVEDSQCECVDLYVCLIWFPPQGGWEHLSARGNSQEAPRAPARSPQPTRINRQVNGNVIACWVCSRLPNRSVHSFPLHYNKLVAHCPGVRSHLAWIHLHHACPDPVSDIP